MKDKSDEELDRIIQSKDPEAPYAIQERERRQGMGLIKGLAALRKPHWTQTPTFWITVAILVVALLSWLFPRTPPTLNEKPAISSANSAPAPTNLPPVPAPTNKTSQPVSVQ
jgi:hypothetical protein